MYIKGYFVCIDSVDIYSENYQDGSHCPFHACIDSVDMWHTLDLAKVAFLAYQFLAGRFL